MFLPLSELSVEDRKGNIMNKKNIILTGFMALSAWTVTIAQSTQRQQEQSQQNYTETEIFKRLSRVKKPQILDVRDAKEYAISHIKGAINTTRDNAHTDSIIATLDPNLPTLTYSNVGRGRGVTLAAKLRERGFKEVYHLSGGLAGWGGAGLPIESAATGERTVPTDKFHQAVSQSDLLLVEFSTIHCPGCLRLKPILAELQYEHKQIEVINVDFDDNVNLFKEEKIKAVPILRLYKKGEIVWEHLGFIEKSVIESEINKLL